MIIVTANLSDGRRRTKRGEHSFHLQANCSGLSISRDRYNLGRSRSKVQRYSKVSIQSSSKKTYLRRFSKDRQSVRTA